MGADRIRVDTLAEGGVVGVGKWPAREEGRNLWGATNQSFLWVFRESSG